MNPKIHNFTFAVLCLLCSHAPARTWTDTQGRTIEAELVSATATEVTLLLSANKKVATLSLTKLSEGDRE